MRRLPILALLLSVLAACGTEPPDGWAELCGEVESFEVLEDGAVLRVERGSQGGMHVFLGMRTGGIEPGPTDLWAGLSQGTLPVVGFEIEGPEGILTPDNARPTVLERVGGGEFELLDNLIQFRHFAEWPTDWAEINFEEHERAMELQDHVVRVVIEDANGQLVLDERTVRLSFPPWGSEPVDTEDEL